MLQKQAECYSLGQQMLIACPPLRQNQYYKYYLVQYTQFQIRRVHVHYRRYNNKFSDKTKNRNMTNEFCSCCKCNIPRKLNILDIPCDSGGPYSSLLLS